jgi:hypothetical protein
MQHVRQQLEAVDEPRARPREVRRCVDGDHELGAQRRELRREGDRWKVVNGLGEFWFEIRADEATGVVDMLAGPTLHELAIFPARVVALGPDATAFTFTMFHWPGQPQELFESQHASLVREFENLEREFAA